MQDILKNIPKILNSAIIIAVGTVGIKAIIDYLNNRNSLKYNIYLKQFNNVYLNLFIFLEPYLYKELTIKEKKKIEKYVNEKIKENYIYFFPTTLSKYKNFQNFGSHDTFVEFCKEIDYKFEYLKSKLYLSQRDDEYRKTFNQTIPNFVDKTINNIEKATIGDILILLLIVFLYSTIMISITLRLF